MTTQRKTHMKILEKILAFGIVTALILKFTLIPGGDTLTLWTILLLACLYYPLGFLFFNQIRLRHIFKKDVYKNLTALKIVFAAVAGLGLSIVCIGILFKLLQLTGADQMLLMGLVLSIIVFVVSMFLFLKNKDVISKSVLKRISIIGGVGFFLLLTPELSIIRFQFRNHPAYIEAYANYLNDPTNDVLRKKEQVEYYRIRLSEEELKMYEKSLNK